MKHKRLSWLGVLLLMAPAAALAHEVYVLSPAEIAKDKSVHSVHLLSALNTTQNIEILLGYTLATGAFLLACLWLRSRGFWRRLGGWIDSASVFAPDLIRVVFGFSLISSAMHHAVFGPELPVSSFPQATIIQYAMLAIGAFLVVGFYTRLFSLLSILLWLVAFADKGWYILTYANYLGEAAALALLPQQRFSLDYYLHRKKLSRRRKHEDSDRLSMPVTRILFGFSLLFAAINIKILHPALSLDVVNTYHLTRYFPYDPLFVVLGSALVEILFAVMYMLGLLQRVISVVFVGFLVLSILFFKEAVWPHYLLVGLAVGIFLHRPDVLSLDYRLSKK